MRSTFVVAAMLLLTAGGRAAAELPPAVAELIERAGNTEDDHERQTALEQLAALPLEEPLNAEAEALTAFVRRWNDDKNLHFYSGNLRPRAADGLREYDFKILADSPLRPIAELYRGRILAWEMIENSTIRVVNPTLRALYKREAIQSLQAAEAAFPKNRIPGAYLGRPIPWPKNYPAVAGAPKWALLQREHIDRFRDIIHWWIDHRQQPDGSFGGSWGDDCEMWRWWAPVLVSFEDPKITVAAIRTARASLARPEMRAGFGEKIDDVEHGAEDTTDSIVPLMLLEPNDRRWEDAARRLPDLMTRVWTGTNDRGGLQFRSYWYGAGEVSPKPEHALDVIGNVVALSPSLLLWQKTRDPELGRPLTAWLDTWVEATARAENGKPAGILPASIRWPDGKVAGAAATAGAGDHWWEPVPPGGYMAMYYVWPSVLTEMTDAMLVAHLVTGEEKYLAPLRSMAAIRLKYLKNPPAGSPIPGSEAWCAAQLGPLENSHNNYGALVKSLARCRALTGTREFDELIAREDAEFAVGAGQADRAEVEHALGESLKFLGVNFPLFTNEVRYTDRVLRHVHFLAGEPTFPFEDYRGVTLPKAELIYRMTSGDGNYVRFPMPAVRWRIPPEEIAIWVRDAGRTGLEAELFHFGETPRPMKADLPLLAPGRYRVDLLDEAGHPAGAPLPPLHVEGRNSSLAFQLPPRRTCVLRIAPEK